MTTYSTQLQKILIDHAKMCVQLKVTKDQNQGKRHHAAVSARIRRGEATLKYLTQLEKQLG